MISRSDALRLSNHARKAPTMPTDTPSESARQLQAYRKLLALRSAARDLASTASDRSDLDNLAVLVENLCEERLSDVAGLAEWVTS